MRVSMKISGLHEILMHVSNKAPALPSLEFHKVLHDRVPVKRIESAAVAGARPAVGLGSPDGQGEF